MYVKICKPIKWCNFLVYHIVISCNHFCFRSPVCIYTFPDRGIVNNPPRWIILPYFITDWLYNISVSFWIDLLDWWNACTLILMVCFTGLGQCQSSNPGRFRYISQCINTKKHNVTKTVYIFPGMYRKFVRLDHYDSHIYHAVCAWSVK